MSDINTERIKSKFYAKLIEEEKMKQKKLRLTPILFAAAIVSLTSATALAANLGIFNKLFNNFNDVLTEIRPVNIKSESKGITMELSSYLADTKGIIPELIFTKNDGSSFASDVVAIGASYYPRAYYGYPDIEINNIDRASYPRNIVSDDGKSYYCLPIVHYDIEKIINSTLEIGVSKLIYNLSETNEIFNFDIYEAYKNSDLKILDNLESEQELYKLFEGVSDNPIKAEFGTTIDSIVFAKVNMTPPKINPDIEARMPPADGVDIAAIYSDKENNIIGIKYTKSIVNDDKEYTFSPINLVNNKNRFGMGIQIDEYTEYIFFRVDDFEDLKYMNGFNFIVNSNNFINGNWNIKTNFSANQDLSRVVIDKSVAIEDLNTTLTLTKADISLLSTRLSYEIRDSDGNLVTDISGYDMNVYYFKSIFEDEIKLQYSDGSEINLSDSSLTNLNGIISVSYDIEMTPYNYTLMNTSKLSAIIINGESFKID